ncbi:PKD domain-containing protein [Candidatus Peregrinibacteria bacterium]|nr:PKD domain-containing protein [Candidatus Peregrinibacteria bacterium]
MPTEEEKNIFLESLQKEREASSKVLANQKVEKTPPKKQMSGTALFATLFLLFLLIVTLLIFILSVGGGKNPILQSFGIESGEVKEFLKSLVNWIFGGLTLLLLLLFSIGIFRGISAKKEEREKRRNSLVFGTVSGGLIFVVVLAWLGMFAYINTLEAGAVGTRNQIEVLNLNPGDKIIAPLTIAFSAKSIAGEFARQKKKVQRFLWDKESDGTYEVNTGRDPTVNLWFATKGVHVVSLMVEIEGENPQEFQRQFEVDDVLFVATPDAGEVPLEVSFDAKDITEGLSVQIFEWDFDGDSVVDETTTNAQMKHTYQKVGVFPVRLRIRLQDGRVETYERRITTTGATSEQIKAIIEASLVEGFAPLKVEFSGKDSFSSEGKITGYFWNLGEKDTLRKGDVVTHTYVAPGTYRVELRITNDIKMEATDTVEIVVKGTSKAPEIVLTSVPAGDASGKIIEKESPLTVTFDASQSKDPDGDIVSWDWDVNTDGIPDEYGEKFTYTFETAGEYTVTLTLRDADGNQSTATREVLLGKNPVQANIIATPETGSVPLTITFDGSGSSCGIKCKILSFEWNFGDGTQPQLTGAHTTHTFTKVGTFTVGLQITSENGDRISGKKVIAVREPALKACFEPSRLSGKAPLPILFKDCSDGTIQKWKWDFGDGYISEERAPEHTFSAAGTYTVRLSVMDENNTTSQDSQDIQVEAP